MHITISVGGIFSMKIMSLGHTNMLLKMELTWVQDLVSFLKFS